jgi:hypothetical protein
MIVTLAILTNRFTSDEQRKYAALQNWLESVPPIHHFQKEYIFSEVGTHTFTLCANSNAPCDLLSSTKLNFNFQNLTYKNGLVFRVIFMISEDFLQYRGRSINLFIVAPRLIKTYICLLPISFC